MKNKLLYRPSILLAVSLLSFGTARAQQAVPNGTMETWAVRNGNAPAQWQTTDDVLNAELPGFPLSNAVTRSATFHGGSFAAQLANSTTFLGVVPGFIVLGNSLGDINSIDSLAQLGGLPYTSRPARMQFYYRFSGTIASPDDRPLVRIALTKTTGGVRQVVASAHRYLTAATTYTLADFPLIYQRGFLPDSVHIAFGSGDFDGASFTLGNTLLIDDITLTGNVLATRDAQLQAALTAYPNPSSTGLFALSAPETALLAAPLTVTDALGRIVLRQSAAPVDGSGSRTVDLRQQTAGIYCLRLETTRGPVIKQLVIR